MSLLRPTGYANELERSVMPGDVLGAGEVISTISTAGSGTLTGAAIATGIIRRTGPGGGFTDTTDTAANIIAALGGAANAPAANLVPGTTFRLRYINTVAQAMTFAAGVGVVAGVGTVNVAASVIRDYLITILNATPPTTLQATFANASTAVTFVLPPGMTSFPLGQADNPFGVTITNGQLVVDNTTGGNIGATVTVAGITMGQGGITGVTLSANSSGASATAGDSLTFHPRVQFDSLGSLAA